MLDDRKAAILQAVVEEYIQTAQPVGSARVARSPEIATSPATVRNEMSALEREGYLAQPHTSAGRIPTDKGYRFFVDTLPGNGALRPAQVQQIRAFFAHAHGELARMLADTSTFLSRLTDYAAVVVGPSREVARLRSVQLVALTDRVVLVVAVYSNGVVEKRALELDEDVPSLDVASASTHLAAHAEGTEAGDRPYVPDTGNDAVDRLTAVALDALVGHQDDRIDQVFVGGAARMAAAFDAVETIRTVLASLEQQYVLVTLLSDVLDRGLSVAIGTEHGVQSLADCSVVVAPYEVEGERLGTVGVLGPTRMHYDEALAAVAVVSKRLGRALSES